MKQKLNLGLVVKRRALTAGEQRLCHSIFSSQLDTSVPQICASYWILRHYAMSPNGHVYFHPDDYLEDYSQASLGKQAWFIHEMTHVWQAQQGVSVFWRALFNRRYAYTLQAGKPFLTYGVEQQAQMVQDYFIQRETGQDCSALAACLPFNS